MLGQRNATAWNCTVNPLQIRKILLRYMNASSKYAKRNL